MPLLFLIQAQKTYEDWASSFQNSFELFFKNYKVQDFLCKSNELDNIMTVAGQLFFRKTEAED